MARTRRGLQAAIVEVILVAVAVAAAFAVASWMWGLWGVESTHKAESIYIYQDSYFNSNTNTVVLHVKTNIRPQTIINAVHVNGATVIKIELGEVRAGQVVQDDDGSIKASPGSDFYINVTIDRTFTPGTFVSGKIFTENGFVYNWEIPSK